MKKGTYSYQKIEKNILNEPPNIDTATPQRRSLKTADYNMGTLDFLRYHELLKTLNRVSLMVKTGRDDMLLHYYALLDELWLEWCEDTNPVITKRMDDLFEEVENHLRSITQDETDDMGSYEINCGLKPLLREIHRAIFSVRKTIGISYPRSAKITAKQKLKKALSL